MKLIDENYISIRLLKIQQSYAHYLLPVKHRKVTQGNG